MVARWLGLFQALRQVPPPETDPFLIGTAYFSTSAAAGAAPEQSAAAAPPPSFAPLGTLTNPTAPAAAGGRSMPLSVKPPAPGSSTASSGPFTPANERRVKAQRLVERDNRMLIDVAR